MSEQGRRDPLASFTIEQRANGENNVKAIHTAMDLIANGLEMKNPLHAAAIRKIRGAIETPVDAAAYLSLYLFLQLTMGGMREMLTEMLHQIRTSTLNIPLGKSGES